MVVTINQSKILLGAQRVHGGCAEGYRMVARCAEGDMEWLLGVQRVHAGCAGGYRMVARCVEGAHSVPSVTCTLCTDLHNLKGLCAPSLHLITYSVLLYPVIILNTHFKWIR